MQRGEAFWVFFVASFSSRTERKERVMVSTLEKMEDRF